ncbi:MAG: hypothetical protein LC802_21580, partial [Acidobacteria bacterium]|nr:hypothetical protein [Acidobacteriota bacterium]
MNREFDKDIDALLRRNARTAAWRGAPADAGATSPPSAHLDADELSAFAENALPAQARALYVAHLADCAGCRRDIARLAGASNVSAESERRIVAQVSEPKDAAWRVWLGALFAPRVMRYAVPAVALCVVGVIAFVALRSRESAGLIAQRESDESVGRTSIRQESPATAPGANASVSANQNSTAGEVKEADSSSNQPPALAPRPESPAGGLAAPKDELATIPAQTSSKNEAPPAPPPPAAAAQVSESVGVVGGGGGQAAKAAPKETRDVARVAEEQREAKTENDFSSERSQQAANKAVQARKVEIEQMPDGSRGAARGESNNAGSRANLPMLSRRSGAEDARAAPPAATKRARAAAPRGGRDDDETTTVSGHRFRRQ